MDHDDAAWTQDPGSAQMPLSAHSGWYPLYRAESTQTSAGSSQKYELTKSRWGFWKQSKAIFCSSSQECIRRHIDTPSHVHFGTWDTSTFSGMCSESLTPSGTSAPAALKQPQWVFHLESMPVLSPSHPWLLPKVPASHHLPFHTFIPCAFFPPIATNTPILLQAPSSESSLPNHTIFSQNTPFSIMLWLKPGLSTKCCSFFSGPHLNYLTWSLPGPFSLFHSWTFTTSVPKLLRY